MIDVPTVEADMVTYSSKWEFGFDLPCTRSKAFKIHGVEIGSLPEIYECYYDKSITLPNEHVPYIRLVFNNDKDFSSVIPDGGGPLVAPGAFDDPHFLTWNGTFFVSFELEFGWST